MVHLRKRTGRALVTNARKLKVIDPVTPQATVTAADKGELSPMDPPDAYAPPGNVDVPVEDLHPFLRGLIEEYVVLKAHVGDFEECLTFLQKERGLSRDAHERLNRFFQVFDQEFARHDRKEERDLFPLLRIRLLEKGEHSPTQVTGADVLQSEHVEMRKAVTTVGALLSAIPILEDVPSREILLDAAIGTGKEFVEKINLHIFREDEVMLPLEHTLLTTEELDAIGRHYSPGSAS